MKRTRLSDRLDVTAIGLGTAPLGGLFAPVSDADAEATIERAWSLGVRFFDRVTLENSPSKVRAPKISTTTPCKVAGGRRHSTTQLDTSGKSGAFFDYSEILYAPVAPQ